MSNNNLDDNVLNPIVRQNFYQQINQSEDKINLASCALSIAEIDYLNLDKDRYLNALDFMADEIGKRIKQENVYPLKLIKIINQYLFDELGFRGNSDDYYDPRNSFLNQVIERRTGIPITLSIVYLETAARLGFPMVGIGMPGHFLIRPDFEDAGLFVDAFNGGEILFSQDCEQKLQQIYQKPVKLEMSFLAPLSKKQILARMLTNLKYIYINRQELPKALAIIELMILLNAENPREIRDRGLIYYHLGESLRAYQDLELYLKIFPNAEDSYMIRGILDKL